MTIGYRTRRQLRDVVIELTQATKTLLVFLALGMVLLKTTETIRTLLDSKTLGDSIDSKELIALAREWDIPLNHVLRGTSVYIRPKERSRPNPEYRKMMEQLRLQLAEKEYQAMVSHEARIGLLDKQNMKEIKSQLSVVINVLLSVGAVGLAAWYWTERWESANRVLACFVAAIVTAIAEVGIYLGYIDRIEQARRKERMLKETYPISPPE